MDPAVAGTVGFVIRLATVAVALVVALSIAGVNPRTLALGGAFTAVIVGLAAQQTLGNVIAGTVLLSARPFRVGDTVRLQGGQIAGQIEGTIGSLGLLYTTFATERGLDHGAQQRRAERGGARQGRPSRRRRSPRWRSAVSGGSLFVVDRGACATARVGTCADSRGRTCATPFHQWMIL